MDIEITIPLSTLSYSLWLRTSYSSLGAQLPVEDIEFGADQLDAFNNLTSEAARKILRSFSSRQGDVTGLPFEITSETVTYRFSEGVPALSANKTLSLTEELKERTKMAIYGFVTSMWFQMKGIDSSIVEAKYNSEIEVIEQLLHQLHD